MTLHLRYVASFCEYFYAYITDCSAKKQINIINAESVSIMEFSGLFPGYISTVHFS